MDKDIILKKVLLIEDSVVIRRSLVTLLNKYQLEIIEHSRVEDIFSFLNSYHIASLILLDIGLPGMDGITGLSYIKQLSALSHIPVIIISGHTEESIVEKAHSLNVVDYLCKPYVASDLLSRIEKILGPLELKVEEKVNQALVEGKIESITQ